MSSHVFGPYEFHCLPDPPAAVPTTAYLTRLFANVARRPCICRIAWWFCLNVIEASGHLLRKHKTADINWFPDGACIVVPPVNKLITRSRVYTGVQASLTNCTNNGRVRYYGSVQRAKFHGSALVFIFLSRFASVFWYWHLSLQFNELRRIKETNMIEWTNFPSGFLIHLYIEFEKRISRETQKYIRHLSIPCPVTHAVYFAIIVQILLTHRVSSIPVPIER